MSINGQAGLAVFGLGDTIVFNVIFCCSDAHRVIIGQNDMHVATNLEGVCISNVVQHNIPTRIKTRFVAGQDIVFCQGLFAAVFVDVGDTGQFPDGERCACVPAQLVVAVADCRYLSGVASGILCGACHCSDALVFIYEPIKRSCRNMFISVVEK